MDIQTEMQTLQREFKQALHELEDCKVLEEIVNAEYEIKFAAWKEQNAKLVEAKENAAIERLAAELQLIQLREKAKALLSVEPVENLPEGFSQKCVPTVMYEKQGLTRQAHWFFGHLLKLDEEAVVQFFTSSAKEQTDGSYLLPENIRALAAVEVIAAIVPEIDEEKLRTLKLKPEPIIVETKVEAWQPPANATAFLTTPEQRDIDTRKLPDKGLEDTDRLLALDEDSSLGESLPLGAAFNQDGTWNEAFADDETLTLADTIKM